MDDYCEPILLLVVAKKRSGVVRSEEVMAAADLVVEKTIKRRVKNAWDRTVQNQTMYEQIEGKSRTAISLTDTIT